MLSEVPQLFGRAVPAVMTHADTLPTNERRSSAAVALRRQRVLLIVESAAGGTGRHVLDLAEGMTQRGHEVHIIYSTGRLDRFFQARLALLPNVAHMPVAMRTSIHPGDLSVLRAIRRYAKAHGPFDVIHGHSSKAGALARLAALGTKARAVYTLHGLIMMDPGLERWKRAMYLAIELGLSLRTWRIIAVSPEEGRAAVKLRLGRSRVMVVPNGVAEDVVVPRAQARRELALPEGVVVVGFIGRLVEQKAPDVLLRAFARAVRTAPNLRLAVVGSGRLMPALQELAVDLRVAHRVLWLGERDARGVIAAFDVFAISSQKEGLPYVVLEAMSCGLPVVATASAGVEILVKSDVNGTVVATGDIEAFADALAAMACDPGRRATLGLASRQLVSRFTIDAMVDQTLAAYRSPRRRSTDQVCHCTAQRGLFGTNQERRRSAS